ncbi:hypothetical protein EB75_13385 [Mycobacterium sp. ST-F2]|nr:hypothetical protein EB75_13385 [Mycobacterium sp. ST-F2]
MGEHAVVLGAGMSGLLAARVLADRFRAVTIVERDELPDGPDSRRGVPQGRHPHALLGRGALILDELYPGILGELVADGAPVWNDGDLSKVHTSFRGHLTVRSGKALDGLNAIAMYQPSRPLLEHHVRRRTSACENVTILDRHDVAELTPSPGHTRITGVRVINRDKDTVHELSADLVVDAMGRGAHTPALLERLGYGRPIEEHIPMRTTYVSQKVRIRPGTLHEVLVNISPAPGRPAGMFLVRYEDDTWIFTVFGMAGTEPPHELDDMLAFAGAYAPSHLLDAVRGGEPLAPVVQHRMPSSQRRRYDTMRRFPEGLIVTGDAMCSFNPIYGQGMSVAALDALSLRDALRGGMTDLPRRYFRAAAKAIDIAWDLSAGSDLAFPEVDGYRPLKVRLNNRLADWVLSACETDPAAAAQFFLTASLIDPPERLLRPSFLYRVARVNRRRRQRDSQPDLIETASVPL